MPISQWPTPNAALPGPPGNYTEIMKLMIIFEVCREAPLDDTLFLATPSPRSVMDLARFPEILD